MKKTNKKLTKQKARKFLKWARKRKLFVSAQSRRDITAKVKELYADGSITKGELAQYLQITKAWIRKI